MELNKEQIDAIKSVNDWTRMVNSAVLDGNESDLKLYVKWLELAAIKARESVMGVA